LWSLRLNPSHLKSPDKKLFKRRIKEKLSQKSDTKDQYF
jgi:hypothetical protein